VLAVGKPTAALFFSGSALGIDPLAQFAGAAPLAIVWPSYPGQFGGAPVAAQLFGAANRWGKLPVTWYLNNYTKSFNISDMSMTPNEQGNPGLVIAHADPDQPSHCAPPARLPAPRHPRRALTPNPNPNTCTQRRTYKYFPGAVNYPFGSVSYAHAYDTSRPTRAARTHPHNAHASALTPPQHPNATVRDTPASA